MWNDLQGEFVRYASTFRDWIRKDGSTRFQPEAGRYHLYISWACPWASRTVIMRKLKGLEEAIGLSVVDPVWNESGWYFSENPGCIPDFVNHQKDLVGIYRLAQPDFNGVESVPVLWDRKHRTIVNNESLEIMRMFDVEFESIARSGASYYPAEFRGRIDETIRELYPAVNNGVYRAGFATSQQAYERAVRELFAALDRWEALLARQRYLCGDRMTEADVCLFTTLFRFDLVYYSHFKCNLRQLRDYPNLWAYTRDIYQTPGVAEMCNADHCKRHYYMSQTDIIVDERQRARALPLNPTRIVPVGPSIDFWAPHGRS